MLNFNRSIITQKQEDIKMIESLKIGDKEYKTVKIGDQIWMAENLNVDTFRNGETIPEAKTDEEWVNVGTEKKPAWSYNGIYGIYGKLYNWFAVGDPGGLAPAGWHVATDEDWQKLEVFLGMGRWIAEDDGSRGTVRQNIGNKLKAKNGWCGTNKSGFSALPGGYRVYDRGSFAEMGESAYFWTSSGYGDTAWCRYLWGNFFSVNRLDLHMRYGFSVRCIKD